MSANVKILYFVNKTKAKLNEKVSRSMLSSYRSIPVGTYYWSGEIKKEDLKDGDHLVTMDIGAIHARHQTGGGLRYLEVGKYTHSRGTRFYKPVGVIRDKKVFLVTEDSRGTHVSDIAPRHMVRVFGVKTMLNTLKDYCKPTTQQELPNVN